MADRRRDAATAGVGYGLVGTGGAIRGRAIDAAHRELGYADGKRMVPSSLAVLRTHRRRPGTASQLRGAEVAGAKAITRRFALGTGLATLGAPAAALSTYDLLRRRRAQVAKSSTAVEGVKGVGEAWKQKTQSLQSGAPPKARLIPIGLGTAGAGLAALAAHRGLDKVGRLAGREISGGRRSALTAMAAVPGTLATIPASRRMTRRYGYTVTPTGTRKLDDVAKSLKILPWDGPRYAIHNTRGPVKVHQYHGDGLFTIMHKGHEVLVRRPTLTFIKDPKVSKAAQDYHGRHVSYGQQRAATMAAGAMPGVGPLLSARQAGTYAPPGQKRRAQARQMAAPVAGAAIGARTGVGAYGLAARSPGFARRVESAYHGAERAQAKLPAKARKVVRLKPYEQVGAKMSSRFGLKAPALAAGLVAGKLASAAVSLPSSQLAISRNIAAERRYNRHRRFSTSTVNKADGLPMTQKQRGGLVRRKRTGAALNVAGGTLGLAGLALLGAKHPANLARREKLVVGAAGVGGVNAFNSAAINHREAVADRKAIHKAASSQKHGAMVGAGVATAGTGLLAGGLPGVKEPDSLNIWNVRGKPRGTPLIQPADPRNTKSFIARENIGHNAKIVVPQVRGGILGFRASMHQAYIDDSKHKKPGNAYVRGMRAGKLEAEHKIVRGMRAGRRATYPLTIGGTALGLYGAHRRRVAKADHPVERRGGEAVGAGLTIGGIGHGVPKVLDRYSRRYANSAKAHTVAAQRLAPNFGGLKTSPAKISDFGVMTRPERQTIYPERTDRELAADRSSDRIGTAATRTAVGRHRGIAAQERHFVEVFDNTSRAVRHVRGPGLALAGIGAAGLLGARKPQRKRRGQVTKAGSPPIQTSMNDQEAHKLVHNKGGYGLTGPLPHGLDRPTRMRAYEARYVASGGRKSQRWQHIKQGADVARNVGIAGATIAGAADLAAHSARAKRIVAPLKAFKRYERMNSAAVREKATRAAVASATLAGGAELAEEGAQHRRARYSSAPGGVAASALRRMQSYTPAA